MVAVPGPHQLGRNIAIDTEPQHEIVDDLLSGLTEREREVMRMRYGIGTDDDLRLDEVGRRLDLSRGRVRDVEAQAMGKLREPGSLDRLLSSADAL
jgi:RNA polymerase sigma factor (sigma-70 family)